jgi:DNA-binding MarR family transcriptional regulator
MVEIMIGVMMMDINYTVEQWSMIKIEIEKCLQRINQALTDSRLSPTEAKVLMALVTEELSAVSPFDSNDYRFETANDLQRRTALARSTVVRAINELERHGWIQIDVRHRRMWIKVLSPKPSDGADSNDSKDDDDKRIRF